jgi:hypothetical protein
LIPKIKVANQPASQKTQRWQCDTPKTDSCFGFRTTCKNKSINKQVKELNVAIDLHRSVAETPERENKSKASKKKKKKTTTFIEMFQISTTELGPPLHRSTPSPIHRAMPIRFNLFCLDSRHSLTFSCHTQGERETHQYTNTTDTLSSEKI